MTGVTENEKTWRDDPTRDYRTMLREILLPFIVGYGLIAIIISMEFFDSMNRQSWYRMIFTHIFVISFCLLLCVWDAYFRY